MTTNPIWSVPVSIQRDMARRGKAVRTKVLAGPRNPLGKRWIGLSLPDIGIHGTITPQHLSFSLARMHPAGR
jgi:L,D-transpeptidase ErfK/SrfK